MRVAVTGAAGRIGRVVHLTADTRPRPDTFYGMGKAACEAMFAEEILATPESDDDRFAALHVGREFCRPDRVGQSQ